MAAGNSIGEAVITIGADASQFGAELAKSTRGATQEMGKSLSSQMSKTLGNVGKSMQNVGRSMTNYITKPALIAGGVIAGLVGALGFKRLIGLDNAQAKLKGLGFEGEAVKRISDQVAKAIEGGMTTMAEGVDIAAGALASGVKEGKDLAKYIKLVGDAAIGSNREVGEMAQIFNRVQGSGKLMTRELNQIEMGMPGFANAMAESLGVPQEEFRNMVTQGKISSEQFLDVMEGFAGGMAEAYADTFSGMAKNVLAYIGIIGESLLGGVFEQSKDALRGFIDILKSDEVQVRAREIGEKLGDMFTKIIDGVKKVIKWWGDLSPGMKKFIGVVAAAAVAAGPLLLFFGKLASGIGAAMPFLAKIGPVLGTLTRGLGSASWAGGGLVSTLFRFALPIGGVISGLIAIWANSEKFREAVGKLGGIIMKLVGTLGKSLSPILDVVMGLVGELAGIIGDVLGLALRIILPPIEFLVDVLGGALMWAIQTVVDGISWLADVLGGGGDSADEMGGKLEGITGILEPLRWAVDKLSGAVDWLDDVFADGSDSGGTFGDILRGIAGAGEWLDGVFEDGSTSGGIFGDMLRDTKDVLDKVNTGVEDTSKWIVNDFIPAVEEGAQAVQDWFDDAIRPYLQESWAQTIEYGNSFLDWWENEMIPRFDNGAKQWEEMMEPIRTQFETIWTNIKMVGTDVSTWWMEEFIPGWIRGYEQLDESAGWVRDQFGQSWAQIKEIGTNVGSWWTEEFIPGWDTGAKQIATGMTWVEDQFGQSWAQIKDITGTSVEWVLDKMGTDMDTVSSEWDTSWAEIGNWTDNAWNNITSLTEIGGKTIGASIGTTMATVRANWNSGWAAVSKFFSDTWNNIVKAAGRFGAKVEAKFNETVEWVKNVPARIGAYFGNLGGNLVASGESLVRGFLNGIRQGFANARAFVNRKLGEIRSLFPFSPAKEGPFSGRGWVSYAGESLGRTFVESTADALDKGARTVSDSLDGIADSFSSLTVDPASVGLSMAEGLADGLGRGMSEVERAAEALARSAQGKFAGEYGMSVSDTSNVSASGDLSRRGGSSTVSGSHYGGPNATTFESGAIVVQGSSDAARTAQEVANRIAEEAML